LQISRKHTTTHEVLIGEWREFIVPMAGVIGSNCRSLSLVEDGNGYTFGEITGKNEIQLTHLDDAEPFSVALDTLKRA